MSPAAGVPADAPTLSKGGRLGSSPVSIPLILAGLLVMALFGLGTVFYVQSTDERAAVLVVATPVAAGEVVEAGDLQTRRVSGLDDAITAGRLEEVVGLSAAVPMVLGQVLTPDMVTSTPRPGPGQTLVGVSLDPTRVPSSGIGSGDRVRVLQVPTRESGETAADPEVLVETGEVFEIGEAVSGGARALTLVVPVGDADRVAAASAAGQVAVIKVGPPAVGGD